MTKPLLETLRKEIWTLERQQKTLLNQIHMLRQENEAQHREIVRLREVVRKYEQGR